MIVLTLVTFNQLPPTPSLKKEGERSSIQQSSPLLYLKRGLGGV